MPVWDGPRINSLIAPAALAASTIVVLYLSFQWRRASIGSDIGAFEDFKDRDKLVKILKELSTQFFYVCRDVAGIAKSVRAKIKGANVQITEEKLRDQLSKQCKVYEKLEEIQKQVFERFQSTAEAVQAMQRHASEDVEVQGYVDGFKIMLEDALSGNLPMLPNVKIPEELSQEKVLEIQGEVHAMEIKKVLEKVVGKKCSLPELGEVLSAAHKAAWEEMFASQELLKERAPEVFHTVLASYMKDEDFAKERGKLDDVHQQKMVGLFRPDKSGAGVPAPVAAG